MGYLFRTGFCMAGDYIITGGLPLNGTVRVPAAKNSVLPLLAAPFLCSGASAFVRVPHLADVATSLAFCGVQAAQRSGRAATCRWTACLQPDAGGRPGGPDAGIHPASAHRCWPGWAGQRPCCPAGAASERGPLICIWRALRRWACTAGRGGKADADSACRAARCGHHPSVPQRGGHRDPASGGGAAQGETVLRGAAREPEIEDLAAFLNRCGGRVQGAGTGTVRVQGGRLLYGCSFAPLPDRIVASTFACACAAAGGRVELTGCAPRPMRRCWKFWHKWAAGRGPEMLPSLPGSGALHGAGGCSPGYTRRWQPTRRRCLLLPCLRRRRQQHRGCDL